MKKVQLVGIVITLALVLTAFNVDSVAANPGSRTDSLNLYMDEHFDATEGGFSLPDGETSRLYPITQSNLSENSTEFLLWIRFPGVALPSACVQ